jgi:hypothetical protein
MPNGKPGDHPLTDILVHKRRTFSAEVDRLIEEIVELGGRKELEQRFNFFAAPAVPAFRKALKQIHAQLQEQAKMRGRKV